MNEPSKKTRSEASTKEAMKRIERQIAVEDFTTRIEKEHTEWAQKPWWIKEQLEGDRDPRIDMEPDETN